MEDPADTLSPIVGADVPTGASLAERAYFELRERIVTLSLPPGSLIDEPTWMANLGVSRTPVREALLRLALEKLVTVIPRRGTFVSEVNVGDVGYIYEFRRQLETLAAGLAAERRGDHYLEEIDATIDELKTSESTDSLQMVAGDQRAHRFVYRMAGNPYLTETATVYYFLALRIWFLASSRAPLDEPHQSLADVLQCIRDRDIAGARAAAEEHNARAEQAVRARL